MQEKSFMMLRNMAASYVWQRSGVHHMGAWSQSIAVPALVAQLQATPQPAEPILLHILRALINFAATGAGPHLPGPLPQTITLQQCGDLTLAQLAPLGCCVCQCLQSLSHFLVLLCDCSSMIVSGQQNFNLCMLPFGHLQLHTLGLPVHTSVNVILPPTASDKSGQCLGPSCFMVVWLSAGSETDRDAIASVAGKSIKAYLHHDGVQVRTAALWVIINLTEGYADHYVTLMHSVKPAAASQHHACYTDTCLFFLW